MKAMYDGKPLFGGGVTIEEVKRVVEEAISGAIEEVYYGTGDAEGAV